MYVLDLELGDEETIFNITVTDQQENFSETDNKKVDLARYIQECLCLPSDVDFADAIDKGGIRECGIDRRHIKIANIIYGPAKASMEGKTVQRTNKMPRDSGLISHLPLSILERYRAVTLGVDVLHINGRLYIIAVSKHIKYYQCGAIWNKKPETFVKWIKKFKVEYMLRGFNVEMVYANRAFASCETELNEELIHLNCCDKHSHVDFVERGIRFIEERIRCV